MFLVHLKMWLGQGEFVEDNIIHGACAEARRFNIAPRGGIIGRNAWVHIGSRAVCLYPQMWLSNIAECMNL
jgi:hypothetical protein